MKSFIQILLENSDKEREQELRKKFNLGKEYTYFYNGKWVIDTFHKLDREYQRGSNKKDQEVFFDRVIDYLINNKKGSAEYLFVSKSLYLAMVVDYRKDKAGRVGGNNIVIVTWLGDFRKSPLNKKSPKEVFAKNGTIKVIVESVEYEIIELE